MSKDAYKGPLEKVNDYCWRIPKSYKPEMLVDGLIYADKKLIQKIREDLAPEQVANVACLPGIQLASIAMPDIHWGYGFSIGGVCATDPNEGGVISPGGVGFDINCLASNELVLHKHGYTLTISQMQNHKAEVACFNLTQVRQEATTFFNWFSQKPKNRVFKLVTQSGDKIEATSDHPFWTPNGMVQLGKLKVGDKVAMFPFQGVAYEPPSDDVIISEEDFKKVLAKLGKTSQGNAINQILKPLKQANLLPLRYSSSALPYLCKILGFIFGDGSIHFEKSSGKGVVSFYGKEEDLELIGTDLSEIGITPSRIYTRNRLHKMNTVYAKYQFEYKEASIKVRNSGFAALLVCLGLPIGNKAKQDYLAPKWLDNAPLWQKRLFLAAFFGAELTKPSLMTGHAHTFTAPTLSMNKRPQYVESGQKFLEKISSWLLEFGVTTQQIAQREEKVFSDGDDTIWLRLILSSTNESLINLWSKVGFEYNQKRSGLASLAIQYSKYKKQVLATRQFVAKAAVAMISQGTPRQETFQQLITPTTNERFIERAIYSQKEVAHRIPQDFLTFDEFCSQALVGSITSGMVWEKIIAINPSDYVGDVYDFTVNHPDHNFIASGFVVSNCGVRLVRTNLFKSDVEPKIKELVDELYRQIPTGVGKSGKYHFDKKELRKLMEKGSRYLLKQRDLAVERDIECTEANGCLADADPEAVSDRALARGAEQCGTLGSGNHFLEVQVVDEIVDEEAANIIGVEKDQICVMIHSGSRGLGYQVCDDALLKLRYAPSKYKIKLLDRQLVCAPVDSPEGQEYIGAMRAAANFAWCNRQLLMWQTREVFETIFSRKWEEMGMNLVYDVAHNIVKFEEHMVNGKKKLLCVHRKGATRAFPPYHPEIPSRYQTIGQPVIIPGDMGRASWLMVGQEGSLEQTFGTTCHGAGRVLSRTAAVKEAQGRRIDIELAEQGVIARARSWKGLAEEHPMAYKNVDDVVNIVHKAGISKKVARLRPIGVIKG